MPERRRYPRAIQTGRVMISVLPHSDVGAGVALTFDCSTDDVSAGGLRIRSHHPLSVGTQLDIRVAFADPPQSFRLKGVVMWRMESESMGVELMDTDPATLQAWQRFVLDRLPRVGEPPREGQFGNA